MPKKVEETESEIVVETESKTKYEKVKEIKESSKTKTAKERIAEGLLKSNEELATELIEVEDFLIEANTEYDAIYDENIKYQNQQQYLERRHLDHLESNK